MPEVMPWHLTYLNDPKFTKVDLVKEGANSQAHIKLFKSRGGNTMTLEEIIGKLTPEHAAVVTKALQDATDAAQEVQNQLDLVTKAKEDAEKALQEAEIAKSATNSENSEEEILKSVKDPAVRALLETQIAKTKAAEAEVKKAHEAALNEEAIAKAKEASNVGAEEAKLAEVYKSLKAVNPELCEDVFGIFKSASAMIAEGGTLAEVGKTAPAAGGSNTEEQAWDKIEKAAEDIAKRDGISKSKAITKAINENSDLYKAYLDAQRGE